MIFEIFENYSFENFPLYGIVISTCLNLKWLYILYLLSGITGVNM